MKKLFPALLLVAATVLVSCDEAPTDVPEDSAPLFKKGGKKPGGGGGGGGGGGTPASPEIAFRTQGSDIAVMDANGGNVTVLVSRDDYGVNLIHPSWSPVGAGTSVDPYRVLFSADFQISAVDFYVNASGTVVTLGVVTIPTGTDYVLDAEYSPDGTLIAFTGSDPSSCGGWIQWRSLYVMPADGSGPATEVHCSAAELGIYDPSWSPDGTAIAFHEAGGDLGQSAIRICNLGPGGCDITTAVAAGEADELGAGDWLNDGSGLLYTSTDVNRKKRKTSVRRVDLAWNGSHWSRPAGSPPVTLFSGSDPSSSPDDSQIAARGITIVDASSFASTSATNGSFPDWRVPVQ